MTLRRQPGGRFVATTNELTRYLISPQIISCVLAAATIRGILKRERERERSSN